MRISDWSSDVCSSDLKTNCLDFIRARMNMVEAPVDFHASALHEHFLDCGFHRMLRSASDMEIALPSMGNRDLERLSDLIADIIPPLSVKAVSVRSEERRVGKECVSTCSSRWSPYHKKKKKN